FLLAVTALGGVALRRRAAGAGPAGRPAAAGRAGLVHGGDLHARVALLAGDHHAVAAVGDAGRAAQRAGVPLLDLAGGRAAVVAVGVPVVALLRPLDVAVATADLGAGALHAGRAEAAGALDPAVGRAAVVLGGVAV